MVERSLPSRESGTLHWLEHGAATSALATGGLPLAVNNARFFILPGVHVLNLASHELGACTRRLSADWQAVHGHGVSLAETFVDPQLYHRTSYRAAGWQRLGTSEGFVRHTQESYLPHARGKQLFIKALHPRSVEWHVPLMT
jgi:hypothetical protein